MTNTQHFGPSVWSSTSVSNLWHGWEVPGNSPVMNVLSVLTEAAKMSDTEQSSSLPYDIERDQECKEFYHGARGKTS